MTTETPKVESITTIPVVETPKKSKLKRNLIIAGAVTAAVAVVVVSQKRSKKSLAEEISDTIAETIETIAA